MRKIVITALAIIGFLGLHAQDAAPTFTVTPSEIDALTENWTIEFDVTGSAVEGLTDVYIWSWATGDDINPSEMKLVYDQGSPSWGSISDNAKLTPVPGEPNKFTLSVPITVTRAGVEETFNTVADLFGITDTPGKIKKFGFLLRSQDGSKQTPGDGATEITLLPLVFESSYFRTFPSKVSNRDVVTVYMDLSQIEAEEDEKLRIADNFVAKVELLDESGNVLFTADDNMTVKTPEGEHALTFLADKFENFPEDLTLADIMKCKVTFTGQVYNQDGGTEQVSTRAFEFEFQDYE